MPEDKKIAVLKLLAKRGVPLIEDDIYGDIHSQQQRPRPFIALDKGGNTLYCSSFSKTIAPGYRIGWVIASRYMQRVLEQKSALTLCGPALPQLALAEFLSSGSYDSHLRRIRRVFSNNMDHALPSIEKYFPKGTRASRPAGGFVLWLELPKPLKTRELFREALDNGICFAPGDVFSTTGRYAHCMRISCAHNWGPEIEKGLQMLGALAIKCGSRAG